MNRQMHIFSILGLDSFILEQKKQKFNRLMNYFKVQSLLMNK